MIGLPYRDHRPVATGLILAFFWPVFGSMMLAQGTCSVGSPRLRPPSQKQRVPSSFSEMNQPCHVMLGRIVVVGQLQEFAFHGMPDVAYAEQRDLSSSSTSDVRRVCTRRSISTGRL